MISLSPCLRHMSAYDVNLMGKKHKYNKHREALLKTSREVDLKVNAQKTKYMLTSRHQNAWQNHNLMTDNEH